MANIYKKLDNGKSFFCRQQLSIKEWNNILNKNNFKIIEYHNYMSEKLLKFWDIGLRNIFPILYYFLMKKKIKYKIKKKFTNYFEKLLNYYIDNDYREKKHGFRVLICQKIV